MWYPVQVRSGTWYIWYSTRVTHTYMTCVPYCVPVPGGTHVPGTVSGVHLNKLHNTRVVYK